MSSFLAYGQRFRRATLRDPCPVCGQRKSAGRCGRSEDGALAVCMFSESDRPLRGGLGWLHVLTPGVSLHPRVLTDEPPVRIGPELAEPERLDAVLGALFSHPVLSLTDRHRRKLLRRGLDAEAVRANGYATLPDRLRYRAVRDVRARFETEGVPGVFYSRRGRGEGYWTLAGAQGLLVPVRDAEGRIRGAQVRPDGATSEGGKYRWVSSNGREGGAGSGTPLHWTLAGDPEGDLWLTEGPLKGDVAAALSGHRFLAFAGTHSGQGRRVVDELARAGHPLARPLVLAVDADWRESKDVRRGFAAIARALDRAGYRVLVATWSPEFGKGIDDALFNGARIGEDVSLVPVETFTGDTPRLRERREVTPWLPPSTVSLAEAEARIRELCEGLIQRPVRGCHVLAATFGVGKTRAACEALANAYRFGTVPTFRGPQGERSMRSCGVTDTREHAETVYRALLAAGLPEGEVALLLGRDAKNCARYAEADALGAHRHSPAAECCHSCPEGEAGTCLYLAQRKRAQEANVVVTCKPALLSESSDLRRFDLVVCDEDLLPTLYETVTLDREHLDRWRAGMDAEGYAEDSPFRTFVRVLELALGSWRNDGTAHTSRLQTRNRAVPALQQAAEHLDLDLAALVAELAEDAKRDRSQSGRLPFESPWDWSPSDGRTLRARMPIRAFEDLLAMLTEELDEPRADTRLWITLDAEGVPPGSPIPPERVTLLAYRPLERVLRVLRETSVLVLDATPDLARLRLIFGEDRVHVTELAVPERLHVTQLSDRLRQTDPDVRAAIRARVAEEVGEPPVVLTRKRIAEVVDRERLDAAGIRAGWFGRHHRATNQFEGEAALVVEDHYALPPDEYRARVEMWRFSGPPEGVPPVYAPYEGTEFEALLPAQGEETDPDVAAYARHSWGAEVRQAIGRLRACRQDREVRVYVTSRDPVPGLRVDRLCSTHEFLHGERRPVSERRLAALLTRNTQRQRDTDRRIAEALDAYRTERGRLPSVRKLQALAGCGRQRAARALQDARGDVVPPDVVQTAEPANRCAPTDSGQSPILWGPVPTDCISTLSIASGGTTLHRNEDTPQTVAPQRIPAASLRTQSAGTTLPGPAETRPLFTDPAPVPARPGRPQARGPVGVPRGAPPTLRAVAVACVGGAM